MKQGNLKRTGFKPKKHTSKSKMQKDLDKQWAIIVKKQWGNRCAYCNRIDTLNSHHIFSRSNFRVRWSVENGISLCAGHHTLSSQFSAHKTPVEFVEWIKERKGLKWYESLRILAKTGGKLSIEDYEAIIDNLKYLEGR